MMLLVDVRKDFSVKTCKHAGGEQVRPFQFRNRQIRAFFSSILDLNVQKHIGIILHQLAKVRKSRYLLTTKFLGRFDSCVQGLVLCHAFFTHQAFLVCGPVHFQVMDEDRNPVADQTDILFQLINACFNRLSKRQHGISRIQGFLFLVPLRKTEPVIKQFLMYEEYC